MLSSSRLGRLVSGSSAAMRSLLGCFRLRARGRRRDEIARAIGCSSTPHHDAGPGPACELSPSASSQPRWRPLGANAPSRHHPRPGRTITGEQTIREGSSDAAVGDRRGRMGCERGAAARRERGPAPVWCKAPFRKRTTTTGLTSPVPPGQPPASSAESTELPTVDSENPNCAPSSAPSTSRDSCPPSSRDPW